MGHVILDIEGDTPPGAVRTQILSAYSISTQLALIVARDVLLLLVEARCAIDIESKENPAPTQTQLIQQEQRAA
jgi:hypothetical protein